MLFDKPFDLLRAVSFIELLIAPSRVEGLSAVSVSNGSPTGLAESFVVKKKY